MMRFTDRAHAGRLLARVLEDYAHPSAAIVALRPGAIDVALAVADVLQLQLFVLPPGGGLVAELRGRTMIVVDDGFATSEELVDIAFAARQHQPARVIAAAPVASHDACSAGRKVVDRCVCLAAPRPFRSVGFWYDDALRAAGRALFAPRGHRARQLAPLAS